MNAEQIKEHNRKHKRDENIFLWTTIAFWTIWILIL